MKRLKRLFADKGEMVLEGDAASARKLLAQHFPCADKPSLGSGAPIAWPKMSKFYINWSDFYFWTVFGLEDWLLEDLEADWYFYFEEDGGPSVWKIGIADLVDIFDGDWLEAANAAGLVGLWRGDGGVYMFKYEATTHYGGKRVCLLCSLYWVDSESFVAPEWLWHSLFEDARAFSMVLDKENFSWMAMSLRKLVCEYHEQGLEDKAADVYSFMEIYGEQLWGDLAFFYFYEDLTIIYRGNGPAWTKKIANHLAPHQLRTIWG